MKKMKLNSSVVSFWLMMFLSSKSTTLTTMVCAQQQQRETAADENIFITPQQINGDATPSPTTITADGAFTPAPTTASAPQPTRPTTTTSRTTPAPNSDITTTKKTDKPTSVVTVAVDSTLSNFTTSPNVSPNVSPVSRPNVSPIVPVGSGSNGSGSNGSGSNGSGSSGSGSNGSGSSGSGGSGSSGSGNGSGGSSGGSGSSGSGSGSGGSSGGENGTTTTNTTTTTTVLEGSDDKYPGCDLGTYYAPLDAKFNSPEEWKWDDIRALLTSTHRYILPTFPDRENNESIIEALIDLWPGSEPGTVHLLYRDTDMPSKPSNGLENWKMENFWPESRGSIMGTAIYTDVHATAPADWSVLDDKAKLNPEYAVFYGECGTVADEKLCVSPANVEAAPDTATDTKVYTPPKDVRGDIARGLFYDALRYVNLNLVDCPPFAPGEYGYLSALLEWHDADPVSAEEITRNDRACRRWQGNRNALVDFPELVPILFGRPDFVAQGTLHYSKCMDETEQPTATPNDCSNLDAGDVNVFGFNSVDPDQFLFYPVDNIPATVGSLYLTTNAWDGTKFLPTGATIEYVIPQEGIDAGIVFAYNAVVRDENGTVRKFEWTPVTTEQQPGGASPDKSSTPLNVDQRGDHVLIYCINADNLPRFLFGLTFNNGAWMDPGMDVASYSETRGSALPSMLNSVGNVVLEKYANWFYNGTQQANAAVLKPSFSNASQWIGSDAPWDIDQSGGVMTVASRMMMMWWSVVLGMVLPVVMLW